MTYIEGVFYADTPEKVDKVARACVRFHDTAPVSPGDFHAVTGVDTEFSGVRVGQESTVARSKLHLLSIAVPRIPREITPRGYHRADPAVVPGDLLWGSDELLRYLGSACRKAVHNLPVDAHSLENGPPGIPLGGGVNTLDLARFTWPDRARGAGYTLDALGTDLLGEGKSESFQDIFSEVRTVTTYSTRRVTRCECGAAPCRKRSTTPGHARAQVEVKTPKEKKERVEIPMESITPDHPKFPRVLTYAARDALLALWIYEVAVMTLARTFREMPW